MELNRIYNESYEETIKRLSPESISLILTDPPYPDQHLEYGNCDLSFLKDFNCRQLIFWSAKVDFPLDYTAIHIWDKAIGCASTYERIFERNGNKAYKLYRHMSIFGKVRAQIGRDVYTKHPSQKPINLIVELIKSHSREGDIVFDPFMGSGTTAVSCIRTNRNYVGSEICKEYYDMAMNRIAGAYGSQ